MTRIPKIKGLDEKVTKLISMKKSDPARKTLMAQVEKEAPDVMANSPEGTKQFLKIRDLILKTGSAKEENKGRRFGGALVGGTGLFIGHRKYKSVLDSADSKAGAVALGKRIDNVGGLNSKQITGITKNIRSTASKSALRAGAKIALPSLALGALIASSGKEKTAEAESKSQQRLMGMVHAYQNGTLENFSKLPTSLQNKIKGMAASMSKKKTKDYAETKHKGMPEKKANYSPQVLAQVDRKLERRGFGLSKADKAVILGGVGTGTAVGA